MLYEGGPEARPESGRNIGRECEDDKHRFRRRTREAPARRLNHSAGRIGPGEAPHWTLSNAAYIEESLSFPQQLCRNGTRRSRRGRRYLSRNGCRLDYIAKRPPRAAACRGFATGVALVAGRSAAALA